MIGIAFLQSIYMRYVEWRLLRVRVFVLACVCSRCGWSGAQVPSVR